MENKFKQHINEGYTFKKDFITLGGAIYKGSCLSEALVKIPLKTINRHGLIAGATGTGKTKSLQIMAEQLSSKGVPVLLMDMKGDLSGLAQAGKLNDHIVKRHASIGIPYFPENFPVELMTISDEMGVPLRATVSEFGPVLFSRILGLNDTQSGIVSVLFKYCDDHALPLLDVKDFRKTLQYMCDEGKEDIENLYGGFASSSVSTILRKLVEVEQQGADTFFGEKSFDTEDLLKTKNGKGVISIIRLTNIQDRPKLFSTFMLSLLAEIYSTFPEQGDQDKPKLAIFIDEAHLVFDEASKALLNQIQTIIKLIRSKGVGVFFCTQSPTDIPDEVLGQLGLKIQHALRAFTAKDRKAIVKTAENYPISEFYQCDQIITELGIGEALVTCLNEKGIPTPLAATMMQAPKTRMDILTTEEINAVVNESILYNSYKNPVDRESAYEILTAKMDEFYSEEHQEENKTYEHKNEPSSFNSARKIGGSSTSQKYKSGKRVKEKSTIEEISKNTMVRQMGRTVVREVTRGIMGIFGLSSTRKRKAYSRKRVRK